MTETSAQAQAETQPQLHHGMIVHVELTVPDLKEASKFYGAVFGWEFHPFQETEWYFAPPQHQGPGGCMLQGSPAECSKTMIYVNVDDIPAALEKAAGLGATVVKPKTAIPGDHGFFAQVRAPEGNVIGVWSKS